MPISGFTRAYDKKFSFKVHIGDVGAGVAFSKMSGLEAEVAEVKQYEGGVLIPHKSAGRIEFKDITLERGVTIDPVESRALLLWFSTVAFAPLGRGVREPAYKRIIQLDQLDREGSVIKAYVIVGAWPKTYVAGEWDNNVDENVIERLVLAYDYFYRTI
jgi:phage tail-like protein